MCARINKPGILKNWAKLILLALVFHSCSDDHSDGPKRAFYHWKTAVTLNESDSLKLDSLGIQRLYIRYFDIDQYEDKLTPLGVVEWKTLPPTHLEIVPCVYITNRAMRFLPDTAAESLALHVFSKIQKINKQLGRDIPEIQMDCDWTLETKDKYFHFLTVLRTLCQSKNWVLSATIRLHQVKFATNTGIPPVDRGMLMYYNMGDLSSVLETNSILNLEKAELYTSDLSQYPLELDLALPLFSWVIQFRGDELEALRSSWNRQDLEQDSLFQKSGPNWFIAKENGLFKGQYILKNDRFRIEEIQPDLNIDAINHLYSRWKEPPATLSLFHYNPYEIQNYSCRNIEKVYRAASR